MNWRRKPYLFCARRSIACLAYDKERRPVHRPKKNSTYQFAAPLSVEDKDLAFATIQFIR